jgi:hypothetical protein
MAENAALQRAYNDQNDVFQIVINSPYMMCSYAFCLMYFPCSVQLVDASLECTRAGENGFHFYSAKADQT